MNVANPMAVQAAGMPAAAQGQAVSAPAQTLTGLFAMEMGNALQGMPQLAELPQFAEGLSEDDMEALSNLMAMIQALFANDNPQQLQLEGEGSEQLSADALQALQTLIAKYGGALEGQTGAAVTQTDKQAVVTAFMNQGLSQEEAETFTNMLLAMAKPVNGQKSAGLEMVTKQVHELFEALGVEVSKEDKTQSAGKNPMIQQAASLAAFRLSQSVRTGEQRNTSDAQTIQNLQMNQALSKYQAETGIRNISAKTVEAQGSLSTGTQVTSPADGQQSQPMTAPVVTQGNLIDGAAGEQTAVSSRHVVHADQFATEMSDLFVKQMKLGTFRGFSEAKITLNPESLGQVDVKLTLQNGMLTAHFTAETKNGKELLDNQMSQLRTALINQGLQVDRLEVSQPQQQQNAAFAFQQQQREQARQQQNNQNQQQKNDGEQAEFSIDQLVEGTGTVDRTLTRMRGLRNVEYTV
ncbi:flagellar hook-length control protein FliK [Brevibacillus migulae]|uniref:flagellar hook-length control protein FliK n=1 Tax=Brevibacillus migulae TaxID=1644114 RepID=UPI00106E5C4F|nr:flagellar hook-length control protein FliK [Brevibacillus migulae]